MVLKRFQSAAAQKNEWHFGTEKNGIPRGI